MAKTATLKDTTSQETIYPITLPQNVVDANGNTVLELIDAAIDNEIEASSSAGSNWANFNLR